MLYLHNKPNDPIMSDNFTFKQKLVSMQSNLLNFACRLTSDRETAQDLVQDTTLKVLSNESKYVDNVNFKGWVFTIMRNIFINNYRRQTRVATVVDSTEGLYHLNLSQESGLATPEGSYAAKEITNAISRFTEEYRAPFTMYLAGYKYGEIADRMHLPLGTVKSRIFLARKRLRKMLGEYR